MKSLVVIDKRKVLFFHCTFIWLLIWLSSSSVLLLPERFEKCLTQQSVEWNWEKNESPYIPLQRPTSGGWEELQHHTHEIVKCHWSGPGPLQKPSPHRMAHCHRILTFLWLCKPGWPMRIRYFPHPANLGGLVSCLRTRQQMSLCNAFLHHSVRVEQFSVGLLIPQVKRTPRASRAKSNFVLIFPDLLGTSL